MRRSSSLPSPASVLAVLALFAALAGSAWAGAKIGTSQIENGAVTKKKLAKGAVAKKQLAKGAVGTKQLADEAVTGAKLDESSIGEVPRAAEAGDADRVGGLEVEKFSARRASGSPEISVATVGTVELRFACDAGRPVFSVLPADGAPAQTVRTSVVANATVESSGQGTIPGSGIDVLDSGNNGGSASFNGTVDALTLDGVVTTVQWAARSTSFVPSANPDEFNCLFWGTATSG